MVRHYNAIRQVWSYIMYSTRTKNTDIIYFVYTSSTYHEPIYSDTHTVPTPEHVF